LKKNTYIIYLYPFFFRKYHWNRYEFDYLRKYSYIEVHELYKFQYPHIQKFKRNSYKEDKYIKNFSSYSEWKKYFLILIQELKKKKIKILVIKEPISIFSDIKISYFLKKNKISFINLIIPGLPSYNVNSMKKNFFKKILYKLKNILVRPKNFFATVINLLLTNLEFYLNLLPSKYYVAGKLYEDLYKKLFLKKKKIKILSFNAPDYSNYLIRSKTKKKLVNYNYAVFVANPPPGSFTDSSVIKSKLLWTANDLYPLLNIFFKKIEEFFKIRVVIALHPKSEVLQPESYNYYNRNVFYNKTDQLIKSANFVISMGATTASSFAVLYKKPILFLTFNKRIAGISGHQYDQYFAEFFDSHLVNISDANYKINKNIINFKVNQTKYNLYKLNYLSSILDRKPNYRILIDELKN